MNEAHNVEIVQFNGSLLRMKIDGDLHEFDLALESRKLANATLEQLAKIEVSPSGYGLHWPDIDEDLSIDGLLRSASKVKVD